METAKKNNLIGNWLKVAVKKRAGFEVATHLSSREAKCSFTMFNLTLRTVNNPEPADLRGLQGSYWVGESAKCPNSVIYGPAVEFDFDPGRNCEVMWWSENWVVCWACYYLVTSQIHISFHSSLASHRAGVCAPFNYYSVVMNIYLYTMAVVSPFFLKQTGVQRKHW